ncbi:hypothetical protein [Enterovirga sp. CN4-39]|uniref:hypothetical protein n=1 Tax=Enterovirga sp. CN4-39 TaxID=3400910 RepID=UPI003C011495
MPSEQASLAQVLGALQGEVADLAQRSEGVQEALSRVLASADLTSADLVAVQDLDLIAQHLGALAAFVESLSAQVAEDWTVTPALAAATISLSGLARRLSLQPSGGETDPSDDPLLF